MGFSSEYRESIKIKHEEKYYATKPQNNTVGDNNGINILSFLIPLAGIIIGSIRLASDNKKEEGKSVMKFIIISTLSIVVIDKAPSYFTNA